MKAEGADTKEAVIRHDVFGGFLPNGVSGLDLDFHLASIDGNVVNAFLMADDEAPVGNVKPAEHLDSDEL